MAKALPQVETALPQELQGLPLWQLTDIQNSLSVLSELGLSNVASMKELSSKVDASLTSPEDSCETEYNGMCKWAFTRSLWRDVEHPDISKFCKIDNVPQTDAITNQEELGNSQEREKTEALANNETENQQIRQQLRAVMVLHSRRLLPELKSRWAEWEKNRSPGYIGYKEHYRKWVESQLAAAQDLRLLENAPSWKPQVLGDGRRVLFQEVAPGCPQPNQPSMLSRRPKIAPSAQAMQVPATRIFQARSEIITLHMGSSGCNLGVALWQQLCSEHLINSDGMCAKEPTGYFSTHFQETEKGRLVPRAILVDAQSSGLSEAFASKCFAPQDLIHGNVEDEEHLIDASMDGIRMQMEKADAACGFVLTFSCLEDAGSALARKMGPLLSQDYGRTNKWAFSLVPSSANNDTREYFNSVMSLNSLIEHNDIVTFADSVALQTTCNYRYSTGNKLMAEVMSACTSPQRFCPTTRAEGSRCCTMQSALTNLVPYPRIHFTTPSMANQGNDIVLKALENDNLCTCVSTGTEMGTHKNMALAVFGRGLDAPQVTAVVAKHKLSADCVFVDWSPVGYMCGCFHDQTAPKSGEAVVICNSSRVKKIFESWSSNMDKVKEANMDAGGELEEMQEELSAMMSDYDEVITATDQGSDEE